jgi:hypothetical protein
MFLGFKAGYRLLSSPQSGQSQNTGVHSPHFSSSMHCWQMQQPHFRHLRQYKACVPQQ